MRVAHIVPTYWPAVRYGGPIFSVHGLCRALVEAGVEVDVYTTNVDGRGVLDVPLGVPVDVDGVNVRYFPTSLGRRLYRSPQLARSLEENMGRYHAIHTHSIFLWPVMAATSIAHAHEVPVVSAPRGMLVKSLIEAKGTLQKRVWLKLVEQRNLERASLIHVTSAVERADIKVFDYALKDIAVVPNGIVTQEFAGVSPLQARDSACGSSVLCLGRITWKKGLDLMISALRMLPGVSLTIAGNDDEGYTQTLMELAKAQGVTERVTFTGPVYGQDKLNLIEAADIVVLPSRNENFANVILEAMASGRPVVVTAQVGAAELVLNAACGRVVDANPSSIAMAVRRILSDPELAGRLGESGRAFAREQLDWSRVATDMIKEYEKLTGRAVSAAPADVMSTPNTKEAVL